jgi:hypothetical protein
VQSRRVDLQVRGVEEGEEVIRPQSETLRRDAHLRCAAIFLASR